MIERNKLGMLCFIASEAVFFSILILAYIYYRPWAAEGPNAASSLDRITTAIFSVPLLASSLTLWRAEKSAEHQEQSGMRMWLLITIVLGAVFLFGQIREYAILFSENITVNRNIFGSTFFTLTGFHGLHVFSGLIALLILLGLTISRPVAQAPRVGLEAVGWYWHFVDAVWILIFGIIYLLPLFI